VLVFNNLFCRAVWGIASVEVACQEGCRCI